MLWASGSQGWTVPGMRRVRYYLTSYKLALPDITRVPPATNIALRRRLATEWKMCARDDSEAIQRRSHPPRWTVCSGTTCDCVCGPREAWTEPTIMPTVEPQSNTLTLFGSCGSGATQVFTARDPDGLLLIPCGFSEGPWCVEFGYGSLEPISNLWWPG